MDLSPVGTGRAGNGIDHLTVDAGQGASVHVATAGSGPPLVLLHGWPQTWFEWVGVIDELAARFRLIVPDLPGLGDSSPPPDYRKPTIAAVVADVVRDLAGDAPVGVVGHDWGGIVALFWAAAAPEAVSRLAIVDVVTPLAFESLPLIVPGGNPAWHFAFHGVPGLPELLVAGREDEYLRWWFDKGAAEPGRIDPAALSVYAEAYRRPGAMSAGFDYYRTAASDLDDARKVWASKLALPVLAIGGAAGFGPAVAGSLGQIAEDVTGVVIEDAGHWIPDEQPGLLAAALADFFA